MIKAESQEHRYLPMAAERRQELIRWNRENGLNQDEQWRNVNHAFESYTRARRIYDGSNLYRENYSRLRWDLFQQAEANMWQDKYDELERTWPPERTWDEAWFDEETTKARKIEGEQLGIKVECEVEWSPGIITNPLLVIKVRLAQDSPTYFASHLPAQPGLERHVSIVHTHQAMQQIPHWGILSAFVFQRFHRRTLFLIPRSPTIGYLTQQWSSILHTIL